MEPTTVELEMLLQAPKDAANMAALTKLHDGLDAASLFVAQALEQGRASPLVIDNKKAIRDCMACMFDVESEMTNDTKNAKKK